MIFGYLKQWNQQKHLYAPTIQKALDWLQTTNLESLPTGRHLIEGERMYAMINEYMTEPKEKRQAEAHRKYVDVQYVAAGEERIGIAPLVTDCAVLEDKLVEKDVIFYANPADEIELCLKPGMFAVLFPWEVHRPNCAVGKPGPVRKVVIKISAESLQVSHLAGKQPEVSEQIKNQR